MSKYLIKILSICAFVVMVPLIILGTALCVTETQTFKLRLFVDGCEENVGECNVLINGEARENNTLSLKKNSEVTISFVTTGYDFAAWYNGSNTTYQADNKVFSKNSVYSFKLTNDLDLTAKCNVKTYNITYGGKFDDESSVIGGKFADGTDITSEPITYKYGETLQTLESKTSTKLFAGWAIAGETATASTFAKATFDESRAYTLEPVWKEFTELNFALSAGDEANTKDVCGKRFDEASGEYVYENISNIEVMYNITPSDIIKDILLGDYEAFYYYVYGQTPSQEVQLKYFYFGQDGQQIPAGKEGSDTTVDIALEEAIALMDNFDANKTIEITFIFG